MLSNVLNSCYISFVERNLLESLYNYGNVIMCIAEYYHTVLCSVCVCVCVCVSVCVCLCACVYYICIHVCFVYVGKYVYGYFCVGGCMYMFVCRCVGGCVHVCVNTMIPHTHTHIHTHTIPQCYGTL